LGRCLERAQEYDQALTVYASYLEAQPDRAGSASVRARQSIARRNRARVIARSALNREAELAQTPSDPTTVAVLPIDIVGDSTYRPLSRGLAQIFTTDLALLQRFTMVERLQIGVLVEEIRVGETGRIDPATAARVGHLARAGRLVQGLVTIPPRGTTRMEASVVLGTGEVTTPARQAGRLRDLLKMEKQLVVDIARQLGYQLSQAELRLILENGTQNLVAFLAYSQGLDAEDRGDYRSAALYYARAVRADPNFRAAREGYQAAAVGQQAVDATPGAITQLAAVPTPVPDQLIVGPQGSALTTTILDVAGTQAEVTAPTITPTNTGTNTTSSSPPPTVRVLGTPPTASGSVRIFFRLP
jgi:tetratricopeptide (TPR) repeat protein